MTTSRTRRAPVHWIAPLPGGRTIRMQRRAVGATIALVVVGLTVSVLAVTTGVYHVGLGDIGRAILGRGDSTDRLIVVDQRLPRTVAAWAIGGAMGLSGALFQTVSRNPLGSPDIVGFTTGAASGGLAAILLAGVTSSAAIASGTILGGLATALVVYLLSSARGVGGERLILVGIAVGAMLASINDYLITRADIEAAETARAWQFGSLNAISWSQAGPLLVAVAVLIPVTLAVSRPLAALEMGDDAAAGLGVDARRVRARILFLGVALAAVSVAAAGPIGFLALAAPQLAKRLARSAGITLVVSIAMGSTLLVVADFAAQRVLSPFQIPVGLVTGAVGGLYLLWLLSATGRR
ncbi:iron chelate uptake ABC transporter family permease subunit [Gordonia humi]|uniref:Iron complex transport system permease protein n=1 Tax=Gordonia humi TaxID=686429 RepID=A0A840F993_9ACTN|nr:iron complex transport system permease protein [Gordonia humi]